MRSRARADKSSRVTIVSWNAENVAPLLARDAKTTLRAIAEHFGSPDVLCLQEVRVRAEDAALAESMASALPGYVCHYALNRDKVNVTSRGGRAYGVATFVKKALRPLP